MSATLKDIAKETGLSIATISKYINGGSLKENNRIAIEKAIKKLDYTINEYARGLKSNKSKTIGIIIPELSNIFITQIITRIEELLRAKGYSIIICDCHTSEALECDAVNFLLAKKADGIISMPVCKDGKHLQPALKRNTPIVLIDRKIPNLNGICDCVLIDNSSASKKAVSLLVENNHKNIGILVGPKDVYTSNQRLKGYIEALKDANISINNDLIAFTDYTVHGGYESMSQLLNKNPDMTAVFVTNYEMTLGAFIACNENNIKIPNQLSFIGFDNADLFKVIHPKLTVINQPLEEMGTQVAYLMLKRLTEDTHSGALTMSLSASMVFGNSIQKI